MTETVSETTMFTKSNGKKQETTLTVTLVHDPLLLPDVVKLYREVGDSILNKMKNTDTDSVKKPTVGENKEHVVEKYPTYTPEVKPNGAGGIIENGEEWSECEKAVVIESSTNKDALRSYRNTFPKSKRTDSSILIMRGKLQRSVGVTSKKKL